MASEIRIQIPRDKEGSGVSLKNLQSDLFYPFTTLGFLIREGPGSQLCVNMAPSVGLGKDLSGI